MNKHTVIIVFACFLFSFTGCKKDETVFNIKPPFEGAVITLQGLIGAETGVNAGNSVFVDMSKNIQTSAARIGWDLGFYSGKEYKVVLNHSVGATAIQLDKTDLREVTAADSAQLVNTLELGNSKTTVDPMTGDFASYIAGTVIKEVAENDADNKVYLINRGNGGGIVNRHWIKIKLTRLKNGYRIQYGNIDEPAAFRTIELVKNASFNFSFISFIGSVATVEPAKPNWDFEWTLSTYQQASGFPSAQPDFVLINFGGGVTAAQVIFSGSSANSRVNYDNFKEENLTGITFSANRDVIGTNWRNTDPTQNNGAIAVFIDRFYLIKDAVGNVYKLRFNKFSPSDGATRGRPVLEFSLVQAGPQPDFGQ